MDNPGYVKESGMEMYHGGSNGHPRGRSPHPPQDTPSPPGAEGAGGTLSSGGQDWDVETARHRYGPERGAALQNLICGFYGLIVFILGFTFITGDALGNSHAYQQEYVMLLHVAMFGIGTLFCLYILWMSQSQMKCKQGKSVEISGNGGEAIIWHPEGISLFLRLGAVLFGATAVAMDFVRFAGECRGKIFMMRHAFALVFVVVQTGILVWTHKMCIQVRTLVARWGFAHLIAVNLSQWAYIVVFEAQEMILGDLFGKKKGKDSDYGTGGYGDQSTGGYGDHGKGGYEDHSTGGYASNSTGNDLHSAPNILLTTISSILESSTGHLPEEDSTGHVIHKRAAGLSSLFDEWAGCGFSSSTQFKIAPYLFPCMIEYVLIMAAINYKFYFNIGNRPEPAGHMHLKGKWTIISYISYGTAALFGLTCIVIAVIASIFIFEIPVPGKYETYVLPSDMFYIGEISVLCLGIPISVLAAIRLKDLGWRRLDDMLDGRLLLMTYVGTIMIDAFSLIAGVRWYPIDPVASPWEVGRDVLHVVQCLLQVGLILDGLSRCANSKKQAEKKPGQAVLLLLLMFNVGMWLLMVFEPKMTSAYPEIQEEYYGSLAWNIIKAVSLPLIIFFRFHSIVCLADIMKEAYLLHPHRD